MTDELADALLVYLAAKDTGALHPAIERICEAAGVVVISPLTARALDSIGRRLDAGKPVSHREISLRLYSIYSCYPDGKLPKVFA